MKKIDEYGFTLLEVTVSLVIISIISISFLSIFASTNNTANESTEKLVVANLADAYLERLKIDAPSPRNVPTQETITMNDREYIIQIEQLPPTPKELEYRLINVVVTASSEQFKSKGVVEGYVQYFAE